MGALVVDVGQDEFQDPALVEKAFQHIIEKSDVGTIVIDLARVSTMTSLGIAVLIAAQGIAMLHRRRMAFASVQPSVGRALDLLGVSHILSLYDSTAKALCTVNASPPSRSWSTES
jgi:anti-anti-sigma factor